jgi:hypothetical protein
MAKKKKRTSRSGKKRDTSADYVDNKKFLAAMIEWKKQLADAEAAGEPKPGATEYIGECFLKIATHLSYRPNFIAYTYREEMISDGIENCLMYASNFDPAKSPNPFSYFTTIIYYAFLRRIQKEKKQAFIKYRCIEVADRRGSYDQWAKREGLVPNESSNAAADYLRLTSTDLANFQEKIRPKRKKKKSKKPKKTTGPLDGEFDKDD